MTEWLQQHWVETLGTLAGLLYIFLEIRQNIWMWVVGLVTSALYIYVFWQSKFYADMSLNVYYVIISAYGWYCWKYGNTSNSNKELGISRVTLKLTVVLSIIAFALFIVISYILCQYTDSELPYWDALTTALSIVATWMLTRKIMEQWLVWIVVNGISMGLYMYKELYPTTLLFFVYFALAIVGYREWQKQYKKQA